MNNIIPSVKAIIENNDGKILLLKRSNTKVEDGKWNLPGGKIEFGEKVEDACIREVKEETNLDIFNLEFLFFQDNLPAHDISTQHVIALYFKADFKGKLRLNEESSDFIWINKIDIDKLEIAFHQKEVIKRYLK